MKIVNIQQRSDEWYPWRNKGISASEWAVILGLHPDKTIWRLWAELVGKVPRPDLSRNPNVIRGIRKEDLARQVAEELLGEILLPVCAESDIDTLFRASLDGMTADHRPVELKCPAKSTFDEVREKKEHSKAYQLYYPQVQAQMLTTGGHEGYLLFYFDEDGEQEHIMFTIKRDEAMIQDGLRKGREFWDILMSGEEPPIDPLKDIFIPKDDARSKWATLASDRHRISKFQEEAKKRVERLNDRLKQNEKEMIAIMGDFMRAECDGITITRYVQQGKVNYGKLLADHLPKLDEATLDTYRGSSSERTRVSLTDTTDAEAEAAKHRRESGEMEEQVENIELRSVYNW